MIHRGMKRFAWRAAGFLLLLPVVWGAHAGVANYAHPSLATLGTGTPDPHWATFSTGKYSSVLGTYDDGGSPWSVYVRYKGCPVTPRGALRVTVYQNQYKWNSVGQGSWVPDFSKSALLYSMTAIDHKRSDSVLYTWAAHRESSWQVHIDVPSAQGCTWWKYGSETN